MLRYMFIYPYTFHFLIDLKKEVMNEDGMSIFIEGFCICPVALG